VDMVGKGNSGSMTPARSAQEEAASRGEGGPGRVEDVAGTPCQVAATVQPGGLGGLEPPGHEAHSRPDSGLCFQCLFSAFLSLSS
jgi:hypothetical protein